MMRRLTWPLTLPAFVTLFSALLVSSASQRAEGQPDRGFDITTSRQIHIGGGDIQVDFASGETDLPIDTILAHVQSAGLRCHYRHTFVDSRSLEHRIVIIPVPGKAGIMGGTTWGDMHVRIKDSRASTSDNTSHHCRPYRRLDDDSRTGTHGISLSATRTALDRRGHGHLC